MYIQGSESEQCRTYIVFMIILRSGINGGLMMAIKEARKAAGLTQKQFSELFDPPIPLDTVKNWDSGKAYPPAWAEGLILEKLNSLKPPES